MMYPGGNEVNVAALTTRYGQSSSYIGCVGSDIYGTLIRDALEQEGVDLSHCHVMDDVNTFTEIFHANGEREFGKIRRGASTHCTLSDEDTAFILDHRLLHTGFYSRMEEFLEAHHDELLISFDFTEYADEEYLQKYLPYVDIAFVSAAVDHDLSPDHLKKYYALGPEIVILTMGSKGAYLYDGDLYFQPAVEIEEVVDTLGAGDSFISRFLVEYLRNTPAQSALQLAAEAAAETCQYYGAFDHGMPIPE